MVNQEAQNRFLAAARKIVGADWVDTSQSKRERYGEVTLPGGDVTPPAVIYPKSTKQVQDLVRTARQTKTPLWPLSQGTNIGIGSRSAVTETQVILSLGRRMNRIIDINEAAGFAVVEPGVSYRALHDALLLRGGSYMIDCTSGPPEGSVLGNAMDKGAGYTPYFDHFGMSCSLDIVLGTGELLKTGDGAMAQCDYRHYSKYTYGPFIDGLFTQSNYGIATKMGIWLMPAPPKIRSFFFVFPQDDDIGEIIDLVRPMKMNNFVPTLFRVSNDLYVIGSEEESPAYAAGNGDRALSDDERRDLQKEYGLGAWIVAGAFYGASDRILDMQINRIRAHFEASCKARFVDHKQALEMPALNVSIDAFSGTPSYHETKQLKWRRGGGNSWFTPGVPMVGNLVRETSAKSREIMNRNGLDYLKMYVCGPRFSRGLHSLVWDKSTQDSAADAAYREMSALYDTYGIQPGRAPTRYQGMHMEQMDPVFRRIAHDIKQVLDPDGIIAPGKYGIAPQ